MQLRRNSILEFSSWNWPMSRGTKGNNKKIKETGALYPWDLGEWDDETLTAITTALFRTILTALGVQKAHGMLEEKRTDKLPRAKKLERELNNIGASLFYSTE